MKYIEYVQSLGRKADKMRQGQLFLSWLRAHRGHNGIDPELSSCWDDRRAWETINKKYGEHLFHLT